MRNIILDTDIGDDIDDAFALLLCMRAPELNLLGVTTVYRNTVKRAKMAKALIAAEGKNIEVYAGCADPYKQPIKLFNSSDAILAAPCQYNRKWDSYEISSRGAVEFIIETAHKEDRLTVAAIGPLTNIARAVEKDPKIALKLTVVMMGGSYEAMRPEWNIICDPEAAEIVFKSGCEMYCVGLNVTEKCPLPDEFMTNLANAGAAAKLIEQAYVKWKKFFGYEKSVLHDPLAIMAIYKDVVKWEKCGVTADLTDNRGCTVKNGESQNINLSVDADINAFLIELGNRLRISGNM